MFTSLMIRVWYNGRVDLFFFQIYDIFEKRVTSSIIFSYCHIIYRIRIGVITENTGMEFLIKYNL